jgi:hypothetical protein
VQVGGSSAASSGYGSLAAETNHERTLSVPYVFRNHLIWGEESRGFREPLLNARI